MSLNKVEKIAKILDIAEIPYVWLKRDKTATSLTLADDSSTVSLDGDEVRIFMNCGKTYQRWNEEDIGNALRIIMESRYMQQMDGKVEDKTESEEWVE